MSVTAGARRGAWPRSVMLLAGVAAALAVLLLTTHGVGLSPDSAVYLEAAGNLRQGRGLLVDGLPLIRYPPAYPAVIALVSRLFGCDAALAASWLQAALFGINTVLLGAIVWLGTRSLLALAGSLALFLATAPVLVAHVMAWSEALFLAASLGALLLLAVAAGRDDARLLVLAAAAASLAALARYVGITVAGAVVLGTVITGRQPLRRRLRTACWVGAIAFLPLTIMLARNRLAAGAPTDLSLSFHPVTGSALVDLGRTLHAFVFPLPISAGIAMLQLALIATLLAALALRAYRRGWFRLPLVAFASAFTAVGAIYCSVYVAFLLLSRSVANAAIPFDDRMLLPLWPVFLATVVVLVSEVTPAGARPASRLALAAMLLALLAIHLSRSVPLAARIHADGLGYEGPAWRESPTLEFVSAAAPGPRVYSNGPEIVELHTEREADMVPHRRSATSLRTNPEFARELAELCRALDQDRAMVVFFDGMAWRSTLASAAEFAAECPNRPRHELPDGVVFGF